MKDPPKEPTDPAKDPPKEPTGQQRLQKDIKTQVKEAVQLKHSIVKVRASALGLLNVIKSGDKFYSKLNHQLGYGDLDKKLKALEASFTSFANQFLVVEARDLRPNYSASEWQVGLETFMGLQELAGDLQAEMQRLTGMLASQNPKKRQ